MGQEVNIFFKSEHTSNLNIWVFGLLLFCAVPMPVLATNDYNVDNTNSKVTFSGKHIGMVFRGVFEKWQAKLVLPPNESSSITATFLMSSAKTGDFTYDSTLVEGDWFDIENFPSGHFKSHSIEPIEKGYKVVGLLELKGISKPQTFFLYKNDNMLKAKFTIMRLDYEIGKESDPDAEWVGREIEMTLSLQL